LKLFADFGSGRYSFHVFSLTSLTAVPRREKGEECFSPRFIVKGFTSAFSSGTMLSMLTSEYA